MHPCSCFVKGIRMGLKLRSEDVVFILIGDSGAVVIRIVSGAVCDKYFVDSASSSEWADVEKCVLSSKKTHVYVVLDHSSQIYNRHSGFAKKLMNSGTSAQKDLNVVRESGFNATFLLSANESVNSGKGGMVHMCVECSIQDEIFSRFLGVCKGCADNVEGVFLLPFELANVAKVVAAKEPKKWVVFIACTKVGDFRKIVLCDGVLFSTASVKLEQCERDLHYAVASKVYHDIQDTVKHIVSSVDTAHGEEDFGLYMVVPGSVKSRLMSFNLKDANINVMTPYELGKVLGVQDYVSVSSVCCDTVILSFILRQGASKFFLRTEEGKLVHRAHLLRRFALLPACVLLSVISIFDVFCTVEASNQAQEIVSLNQKSEALFSELESIRNDNELHRINEMYEIVDLYRMLSNTSVDPMEVILPISRVARDDFGIESFVWSTEQDFKLIVELGVFVKSSDVNLVEKFSSIHGNYTVSNVREVSGKPRHYIVHLVRHK